MKIALTCLAPVLIRPSFVLSGTLMNVAGDEKSLDYFLSLTKDISDDYPVVISKFILDAKEVECDGVAKNWEVIISLVSEHVENAGIHSGDATPSHSTSFASRINFEITTG